MANDDEPRAVGWDAIDAALKPVYGDCEPKHYGTILPWMLGGNDPLQGISAYKNLEPLPHFHYVTYGFSELYEKESDNAELSGFGFELTFRLACDARDEEPPAWPLNFLQNIARYVFSTGNSLAEHHHIDLNGPISLADETKICYIALAKDPQLGQIESDNGSVTFLQVVGLCRDEYDLVKDWSCGRTLEYVGRQWPLLITDLSRDSVLSDTELAAEVRKQAEEEGSSQGEVFVKEARWQTNGDSLVITVGATAASDIIRLLRSRLMHDRPFAVYGRKQGVAFQPGSRDSWTTDDTLATLTLSLQSSNDAARILQPTRGDYNLPTLPNVRIQVVPTEIKNQKDEVINVIG
jgi:hypothetical protein